MKRTFFFIACAYSVVAISAADHAYATTLLYYTGSPNSWVTGGETATVTPETGSGFSFISSRNFDNGVSFYINDFDTNPDFQETRWWSLDFAAPNDEALERGRYTDATRFPFQNTNKPGLNFDGNGRGNNELDGYFNILQADYTRDGSVLSLAVDFLQHGEGGPDYDWGSLRYNSDIAVATNPAPIPLPAPALLLIAALGAIIALLQRA